MVPILLLLADVLKVALSKERDEEVANRVVGRGTVPSVLCACALVVIAIKYIFLGIPNQIFFMGVLSQNIFMGIVSQKFCREFQHDFLTGNPQGATW